MFGLEMASAWLHGGALQSVAVTLFPFAVGEKSLRATFPLSLLPSRKYDLLLAHQRAMLRAHSLRGG